MALLESLRRLLKLLPSGPTFREALQEQLGLKLESQKATVKVFVINHVEHPTEN